MCGAIKANCAWLCSLSSIQTCWPCAVPCCCACHAAWCVKPPVAISTRLMQHNTHCECGVQCEVADMRTWGDVMCWAQCLTQPVLLVLDNCEVATQAKAPIEASPALSEALSEVRSSSTCMNVVDIAACAYGAACCTKSRMRPTYGCFAHRVQPVPCMQHGMSHCAIACA